MLTTAMIEGVGVALTAMGFVALIAGVALAGYMAIATRRLGSGPPDVDASAAVGRSSAQPGNAPAFEKTALAEYYRAALYRAKLSFYLSLVFAVIGFVVIVTAAYGPDGIAATALRAVSGTVIEAISGLFFVQSNAAQKTMAVFFDKLRLDSLAADARNLIAEIEDPERRDQLRAQLVLKYSDIDRLLVGG